MANKLNTGSVRRFGSRYGRRVRNKVAMVEATSKKDHDCPYCKYETVKKLSVGIFYCSKCDTKFTGRAYTPSINKTTTEKQDAFYLNIDEEKAREDRINREKEEDESLLNDIKKSNKKDVADEEETEDDSEDSNNDDSDEDDDSEDEEEDSSKRKNKKR